MSISRIDIITIESNEKFVKDSVLKYGCKYSEVIVKSELTEDFVISICYGVIEGNGKTSVLRKRVYNFNTLDQVYFDGNVYDTKYCEKLTFEDVIDSAKGSLSYQLKKLNAL